MGKSDLTFDFGIWGATSPLHLLFHHFTIHISASLQLTSTQVHTIPIVTTPSWAYFQKKKKKGKKWWRKDFPEPGPAFMKVFWSANQPELLPSQCVPTALYKYVYIYIYIYKPGVDRSRFFSQLCQQILKTRNSDDKTRKGKKNNMLAFALQQKYIVASNKLKWLSQNVCTGRTCRNQSWKNGTKGKVCVFI